MIAAFLVFAGFSTLIVLAAVWVVRNLGRIFPEAGEDQ